MKPTRTPGAIKARLFTLAIYTAIMIGIVFLFNINSIFFGIICGVVLAIVDIDICNKIKRRHNENP